MKTPTKWQGDWKPVASNKERVKEGVDKMHEALVEDYLERHNRPSGLPKDWRNRVCRDE